MEQRVKGEYTSNHLEAGDVFTPLFDTTNVKEGKFGPMYSLKVAHNGEEKYVNITEAQNRALVKLGAINGKTLHCVSYDTPNRSGCVGIRQGEPSVD